MAAGCANSEKQYVATANTVASVRKGLINARNFDKINDDDWARIKAWDVELQEAMEDWNRSLEAGDNTVQPQDVTNLIRKLLQAHVKIYGEKRDAG
jgi:hypothetical protein